jgi:hypothetical protein
MRHHPLLLLMMMMMKKKRRRRKKRRYHLQLQFVMVHMHHRNKDQAKSTLAALQVVQPVL